MKKPNSKSFFILAVTFALMSAIWFLSGSFGAGVIQAIVAACELFMGIYYLHKEKNEK